MPLSKHIPNTIRAPFSNYCHGVEVPPGARLMFVSGQLGITKEDVIPDSAEEQAHLCFDNIEAVLASADMKLSDIVRVNAYVTDRIYLADYMAARNARLGDEGPASTLMIVSGFAQEAFKVEIEVVAAKTSQ